MPFSLHACSEDWICANKSDRASRPPLTIRANRVNAIDTCPNSYEISILLCRIRCAIKLRAMRGMAFGSVLGLFRKLMYILSCVKLVILVALFATASLNAQVGGAEDREAGARIFRSHCAPCHGIKGAGGTGPDLTSGRFFHGSSDDELYNNISNGIAGTEMPSQFFNGKQVWQIVTFVRSLSQQNSTAALHGNPSHGQQLVSQR